MAKRGQIEMQKQTMLIYDALSSGLKLAKPNGLPRSAPDFDPNPSQSFPPAGPSADEELYRLFCWLKFLALKKDATAYDALLQIWLNEYGVDWPTKVFSSKNDLAAKGRGRPAESRPLIDFEKPKAIRTKQALEVTIPKPRTPEGRRQALDKVRKRLSRPGSLRKMDDLILDLGRKMLGRVVLEEYREYERKILSPDCEG